ncbi:hypothetical protein A3A64_02470 [Candidatus Gottesmanbacteria bacterium RIFCSPLOWO2_01_FULL_48_11]|uniref:Uncharacterized protein n=2 Tax=Candidatus Gottesmaniibacteriota TaxID=1752720 RepID=A0A0G1TZ60_9BACT|nr:MAG: hypothetical protein UY16_C0038G0004 [Candidatus Gottesmanbacteria bacterium GW2011_GWA2_47_9]OGG27909.1 MAG: hypothetical protein A3A64_02470 [Candidatus Gottesmanbacteria bacterium RIFCSPLOWO2_01_FULL_48_11]
MHRNTYLLIAFLAVIAALLIGINLGRKFASQQQTSDTAPTPLTSPSLLAQPTIALVPYTNTFCGFSLEYPNTLTKFDNASGSAILTNTQNTDESIAIACQEEIPRPPLTAENIESITVWNTTKTASVAARLYHDASQKDGTRLDALIFHHPKTGLDVFLAGFGPTFQQILTTLRIL